METTTTTCEAQLIEMVKEVVAQYDLDILYFTVDGVSEHDGPMYTVESVSQRGNVKHLSLGTMEDFGQIVLKALVGKADAFIEQHKDTKEIIRFEVKFNSILQEPYSIVVKRRPKLRLV